MATFQKVKIKEHCEITSSKRIFADEYLSSGVPFYRGKEISQKQRSSSEVSDLIYISREKFEEIKSKYDIPKEGDLLLTSVGTIGNPYLVKKNEEFYFKDGNLTWFRNFKGMNGQWLYYWLLSPQGKSELNKCTIGSSQKAYTINLLYGLQIELPNSKTQTRIASVLSAYDDLIENNEKRIKVLEEMAQLLYVEWFVKFKFPGHEKSKMVDSGTEYGTIPQRWGVKNLFDSKIFLPCKDRIKKFDGEKLYLDTSCIDGIKITKESLIVNWETIPSRAQFAPVYNSVWFARMSNTYKVLVFDKSSIFELSNYLLSSGMFGLVTEEKYLGFLFALIKSEAFHKQRDSRATGATQVSLTDDGFAAIRVLFPSFELIEKYSNLVNGNIGQILSLQRQNKNLSKTRDLLIPQLVTGKRELKNK